MTILAPLTGRRQFLTGAAISTFWMLSGLESRAKAAAPQQSTPEATEIAWIIAALTPLGRPQGSSIARDTPYFKAIERWFAAHVEHPAIVALGADFNLPRFVGNAADYRFVSGGKLVRTANAMPLWDDAEGDLFTAHRRLVEEFAKKSRARDFLRMQADTLDASRKALAAVIDLSDITAWLQSQFSGRPARVELFVSPLTGGWNWTNVSTRSPRIWVPQPRSAALQDMVSRYVAIASVFTEIDHIYINPVTEVHRLEVETVFARSRLWATDEAWSNYPSGELVFNEYLTWAVCSEFARESLGSADHAAFEARITRFMQERRGFIRFGQFASMLGRLRGIQSARIEDIYPQIIASSAPLANSSSG